MSQTNDDWISEICDELNEKARIAEKLKALHERINKRQSVVRWSVASESDKHKSVGCQWETKHLPLPKSFFYEPHEESL